MINRVKYQDIDFEKYNACLETSAQRKLYAEKTFLDISSDKNWEILVYNDYEAVMPVPFVKKNGFNIVHNPKLCQQLGIFSREDSVLVNDKFYDFLVKNYTTRYYTFNDVNRLSKPLIQRKNFIINTDDYDVVRQRYSPKRKRKLRLDQEVLENSEVIKNPNLVLVQDFIKKTGLGANEKDLQDFIDLLTCFFDEGHLDFHGFFYHGTMINLIAIYKTEYALALLGTFNDRDFVKLSGSSFLIDQVISENIKERIFDFEGSEVPAIEEFFRGFRPELRPYSCIQNSKKEVLIQLFKTIFR